MAQQRSWEQIKRDATVDPALVAVYRALLQAERTLGSLLGERAAVGPPMEDALAAAEAAAGASDPGLGLYLETLRRHLAALGGRLELRAVLPEGETELPLAPPRPS
jgi:hypothetical protein